MLNSVLTGENLVQEISTTMPPSFHLTILISSFPGTVSRLVEPIQKRRPDGMVTIVVITSATVIQEVLKMGTWHGIVWEHSFHLMAKEENKNLLVKQCMESLLPRGRLWITSLSYRSHLPWRLSLQQWFHSACLAVEHLEVEESKLSRVVFLPQRVTKKVFGEILRSHAWSYLPQASQEEIDLHLSHLQSDPLSEYILHLYYVRLDIIIH
jgi:hypothetical protein